MKKIMLSFFSCAVLIAASSCNNDQSTTTTTDSSTVSTPAEQVGTETTTQTTTTRTRTIQLNPSSSYVDLTSGKKVRLRVDTVTKYIVNEVTNQPISYYIDPSTNDTFDRQGRIVNMALRRSTSGGYSV